MAKPIKIRKLYYHRARVPQDILATFATTTTGKPKTEITIPLGTSDWTDAKRKLPTAEIGADALFDAHRRTLGGSTTVLAQPARTQQHACRAFYAALQEQERARRHRLVKTAKAEPQRLFGGELIEMPSRVTDNGQIFDGLHAILAEALAMDIARRLATAKGELAVSDHDRVEELSAESDPSLLPLLARTEVAFLEAMQRDPGALFGSMPTLGTVSLATPTALQAQPGDDPLFSEMADDWFKMRIGQSGNDWSKERQATWKVAGAVFLEICGDRHVSTYRLDDKRELQRVFRGLPSNRNKKLPGKTAREQLVIAAERGLPLMDVKTANEYLRMVEACFEWIKGGKSSMQGKNPFEAASLPYKKSDKKKVVAFTLDELKAIFANPFYAVHADTDARYWTPIIGLFTGARSNSILRLKVTDIRTEDGVTFFDINDDEYSNPHIKRTDKTADGLRRVPLHRDLVAIGFLRFHAKRKGEEMLFSGLKPDGRGKFAKLFGDWWRRHLKAVHVKRGRDTNFHSLRHTWDQAAENSRIDSDWRDRLLGTAKQGMRKVYGGKTEIQLLGEEMEKLQFKGLDLSHLQVRS